ncbi:MAG: hypothetical protein KJO31_09315 [Gammaproteobacteria bacterium]|nr:hypothetical protein [Gammaproteobacteria bacterium]
MRNGVFAWVALGACLVLLVPLIAMQFTDEVRWDTADFLVMGILLLGTGSLFVLVSRKVPRRRRAAVAIAFAAAFLYVWAELAVGLISNLGR